MVIAEAMMRSLPVITTDIAGIPEMLTNGVHGFALPPDDHAPFVDALAQLGAAGSEGQRRRLQMGAAARKHAIETFTNAIMVSQYRAAALSLAPPIILIDMDGCLVDWDAGFARAWGGRSPIDRRLSYSMEARATARALQRPTLASALACRMHPASPSRSRCTAPAVARQWCVVPCIDAVARRRPPPPACTQAFTMLPTGRSSRSFHRLDDRPYL